MRGVSPRHSLAFPLSKMVNMSSESFLLLFILGFFLAFGLIFKLFKVMYSLSRSIKYFICVFGKNMG